MPSAPISAHEPEPLQIVEWAHHQRPRQARQLGIKVSEETSACVELKRLNSKSVAMTTQATHNWESGSWRGRSRHRDEWVEAG